HPPAPTPCRLPPTHPLPQGLPAPRPRPKRRHCVRLRANRSRTVYVPSSAARVCYRYHPLFNHEVQIVRRYPNISPDGILIVLPDSSRCVLPSWMLDQVACSSLTDDQEPHIAVPALRALRQLIDAHPLLSPKPSVRSDVPANTGGDHAPATDSPTPSAVRGRQ